MPPATADEIIRQLGLMPHPEGGFYREVHRSDARVTHPEAGAGDRNSVTSIYFLLEAGDFSAFHRVRSDEIWNLYAGGPLELHLIHQHGEYECVRLGLDLGAGHAPQMTVPANCLQAARPAPGVDWVLCGCVVAPGFDFADFSMPTRADLLVSYPEHEEIVHRFTREA